MNTPFRWCFIGTGTLANNVAQQVIKSGRHQIVSVYTRRLEKGEAFAQQYGGKAYGSALEAISAEGVDGVYVVTTHPSHYEYAKLALTLGKPVLCEKPITVNAREAQELFGLAKEHNVYLAEAMWTWFSPVANQVKQWVDSGAIGEIKSVTANYHLNSQNYAPRVMDPNSAGGALLDVGIYPITYLYRLFGQPSKVVCHGNIQGGVDTNEDVEMTFANGKTYTASISVIDFKGLEKLVITGTTGQIKVPFFHMSGVAKLKQKGRWPVKFKADGGYLNEFDIVVAEIRQGLTESRLVPGHATLDVMAILDQCRQQMGLVYPFEEGK